MLEPHGEFRVGGHRKWTEDELVRDAHEWDALLVTSREQITERVIEAGERLKLIAKIGVGVENIDIPAATRRKIPVTNCPGANAVAVAEAALGLMLAASRRIPQGMEKLREGGWREGIWIANEMRRGDVRHRRFREHRARAGPALVRFSGPHPGV